jgi:hypothetical protein
MLAALSAVAGAVLVAAVFRWSARWVALAAPMFASLLHPSLPTALLVVAGISLFMLLTH